MLDIGAPDVEGPGEPGDGGGEVIVATLAPRGSPGLCLFRQAAELRPAQRLVCYPI